MLSLAEVVWLIRWLPFPSQLIRELKEEVSKLREIILAEGLEAKVASFCECWEGKGGRKGGKEGREGWSDERGGSVWVFFSYRCWCFEL